MASVPPPEQGLHGELGLTRDARGRISRMVLPTGASVSYGYERGRIERRYSDKNGVRLPLEHSRAWGAPHIPALNLSWNLSELQPDAFAVRADPAFPRFLEELRRGETAPEVTRELSPAARGELTREVNRLRLCAPDAHRFLSGMIREKRIRFSPGLGISALVPGWRNAAGKLVILISEEWNASLEKRARWIPFEDMLNPGALGLVHMLTVRTTYFGTPNVGYSLLGLDRRTADDWLMLLGVLHESGHIIQKEDPRLDAARDALGFPVWRLNSSEISRAMFGSPLTEEEQQRRIALSRKLRYWQGRMESGATHFALDALAACRPGL